LVKLLEEERKTTKSDPIRKSIPKANLNFENEDDEEKEYRLVPNFRWGDS